MLFLEERNNLLTFHNLCRSWAERFEDAGELDTILAKLAEKDKQFWPDTPSVGNGKII